jgi:N4-(beta-N-acetylglucosaminyl)-L-asparaginase
MGVGSVAFLSKFRKAATVARGVMEYTAHTLLVGEGADEFAQMIGIPSENTNTPESLKIYEDWKNSSCQPNFYRNLDGCETQCGPYPPPSSGLKSKMNVHIPWVDEGLHDTIGVVSIDGDGNMACGTTTNGANHKVILRLASSPLPSSRSVDVLGTHPSLALGAM